MRTGAWSIGAAALLVLSGCAVEQAPVSASFASVGELSAGYLDAGGTCDDLVEQYSDDENAPDVVTCGTDTVLTLAQSSAQAAQLGVSYRLRDVPVLLGPTWLIQDPDIEQLQTTLGGEIVRLEPATGPANLADRILVTEDGALAQEPLAADTSVETAELADITVVVDPQCDYCAAFLAANADTLEETAESGATVAYQPVAIHDSVANNFASSVGVNAIACAANEDKDAALDVLSALLESQDGDGWTPAELAEFGESAGVDIADCAEQGTFAYWTRQATERALTTSMPDGFPLGGVPTVLVGDAPFAGDVSDPAVFSAFVAANLP